MCHSWKNPVLDACIFENWRWNLEGHIGAKFQKKPLPFTLRRLRCSWKSIVREITKNNILWDKDFYNACYNRYNAFSYSKQQLLCYKCLWNSVFYWSRNLIHLRYLINVCSSIYMFIYSLVKYLAWLDCSISIILLNFD